MVLYFLGILMQKCFILLYIFKVGQSQMFKTLCSCTHSLIVHPTAGTLYCLYVLLGNYCSENEGLSNEAR